MINCINHPDSYDLGAKICGYGKKVWTYVRLFMIYLKIAKNFP